MKILIKSKTHKALVEDNVEVIHDVIDLIVRALLAYGFHPDTVKDGFITKADEYEAE